ncbi:MAG TPA: hypothetical protein VFI25_13285 [Planctomycetota bacterium]|jgi:hypothetical protein|nr:hypothetical protein [Planctomycetota bacterium]
MAAFPLLLVLLPPAQLEVHPVARLLRPMPESFASRYGSHIRSGPSEGEGALPFLPASGRLGLLSADVLQQLLRRAVGGEALAFDTLGDALVVRGPSTAQAKVRDLLEALQAVAAQRIEVEVSLHEAPAENAPADPEKRLASAPLLGRARLELAPGAVGSFGRRTERSFLMDYDVEVAERASVADPEFGTLLAGLGVDLRASPLSDGRIHLTLLADRGEVLGTEPFETGAIGLGTLEIPRVAVGCLAACASLREGERALFEVRGLPDREGPGLLLSVQARALPREGELAGGVRLFSVGFLADAGGRILPRIDERLLPVPDEEAADPETVPPSRFLEWLRETYGAARFDAALGASGLAVPCSDARLAFAGVPKEVLDRAEELRAGMEKPLAAGVALALEVGAEGSAPRASVRLAATVGRSCGALLGVETTSVADYDVEIAQRSVAADPVVVREFDGVVFRAHLLALEGDRAVLEVELLGRAVGPRTRRATGARYLGDVETAPTERAALRRIVTLRPGERVLLGELPPPAGEGPRLAAFLSASPAR